MMTPKEALMKDGTIPVKEGRGRLSREAIERCKELVALGWNIKGYAIAAAPVSTSTAPAAPKVVNKVAVTNEKVVADIVYTYPEDQYKAVDANKKEWGMREVCNTCRVSLVGHGCDNPVILGDVRVTIVPK